MPSSALQERVQVLEATFRHIAATRMAGLPLVHPRLAVQAVDFVHDGQHGGQRNPAAPQHLIATGVLITPWFMNLVRLPLQASAAAALPAPGQAAEHRFNGWSLQFLGHHEAGLGRFAAASLVSPMSEFADQPAAVATARALLEQLRPRPARRGFLFGAGRAATA